MTRRSVYLSGLAAFTSATVMVIVSIVLPQWVSFRTTTQAGQRFYKNIGLHETCSNLEDPPCRTFPDPQLCQGEEQGFCHMWRTVGFLASFAAIVHLAGVLSFVVVMAGGKYQRERGWPLVGSMLGLAAAVEFAIIGIVAYLYDHDGQFVVPGWRLDASWYLCTASAAVAALSAAGLAVSAYVLPPEDGYEFIIDPIGA